jgi:hypothetical protein
VCVVPRQLVGELECIKVQITFNTFFSYIQTPISHSTPTHHLHHSFISHHHTINKRHLSCLRSPLQKQNSNKMCDSRENARERRAHTTSQPHSPQTWLLPCLPRRRRRRRAAKGKRVLSACAVRGVKCCTFHRPRQLKLTRLSTTRPHHSAPAAEANAHNGKPRLMIKRMVLENFKSYAGACFVSGLRPLSTPSSAAPPPTITVGPPPAPCALSATANDAHNSYTSLLRLSRSTRLLPFAQASLRSARSTSRSRRWWGPTARARAT